MPVSEERLAQIRELSNDERVDRMDTGDFTDADWARFEEEMDEETRAFCRETSDPEELHAFADTWNWDKGVWALQDIIDNPACEAATALMLYWRAAPEFYLQFADRAALAADSSGVETFDFLTEIETRYLSGAFRAGAIAFDPADPMDNRVGVYDDLRDSFVRALPEKMYLAIAPGA